MSLLTQVIVAEKYGLRLDVDQLADLLGIKPKTIYNQISGDTFPIPTYVENNKRYADHRDVADHFENLRKKAA